MFLFFKNNTFIISQFTTNERVTATNVRVIPVTIYKRISSFRMYERNIFSARIGRMWAIWI